MTTISVRLPDDENLELVKGAARFNVNKSFIIRMALREYLHSSCKMMMGNDYAGFYVCGKLRPCKEHEQKKM